MLGHDNANFYDNAKFFFERLMLLLAVLDVFDRLVVFVLFGRNSRF